MNERTYTNKQGVTIREGDSVRFLIDWSSGDGKKRINAGDIGIAKYCDSTIDEPFWWVSIGYDWNPKELLLDGQRVPVIDYVVLADDSDSASEPLSSADIQSVASEPLHPFASILAWHKKQKDSADLAKREIEKANTSIIKNGKTDLQQILSLLGISVLTTDMQEREFTFTDDDITLDVFEVFVLVNGYEFGIRTSYGDDCKLNPFLASGDTAAFTITHEGRVNGKEIGLLVKFTTIIGFAYPDHVFSFVYNCLFDDMPFKGA